jgi:hypothetical protein
VILIIRMRFSGTITSPSIFKFILRNLAVLVLESRWWQIY